MLTHALGIIEKKDKQLEELTAALEEAAFEQYYRHVETDIPARERAIRECLLAPELADACRVISDADVETTLKRTARVLADWVTEARTMTDEIIAVKNDIQKLVIETKPELDGVAIPRHEKTRVLFKDDDRGRRRSAYESETPLRTRLAEKARHLFRLRNEVAQGLGFADFPTLTLAAEDLTVEELLAIFERYERETRPAFEAVMAEGRERFKLDRVEPWDLNYIADKLCTPADSHFPAREALASLRRTVAALGRDLASLNIPIHADADIPYGGLCFAVRVPDDIRILLNLKDGMSDYQTLFHEFGHAVHRKFVTPKPYALRVGEAGFFAEGMADVWALFVNRPSWLRANTKLTAAEVDAVAANAARIFAVRTRRFMAAQLVEIQIYRDLDGDWDRYHDEASRRYLGVATGPGIWKEFYFPHLYPVYNKNYMLARVIQRGVHARLEREFGDFQGQPAAFDFLVTHLYAPGASLPWKEKLARVEVTI